MTGVIKFRTPDGEWHEVRGAKGEPGLVQQVASTPTVDLSVDETGTLSASADALPTIIAGHYTKRLSNYGGNLAAAIADLPGGGAAGGDILIDGEVPLTSTTALSAPINLIGQGKEQTRLYVHPGVGLSAGRALIELVGVRGVTLSGLTLDGQGQSRPTSAIIAKHLYINNASDILIDDVTFTGGGYQGSAEAPSGPIIEMQALDNIGDDTFNPSRQVGSVRGVTVRNCRFVQTALGGYVFAIRLLTNWTLNRDPDDFVHHVEDVHIEGNTFVPNSAGEAWAWNTIELAGGGTRNNWIVGNTFAGRTLSHIDFDKVTYGNFALHNVVRGAGRPARYLGDSTKRTAAINVHGGGSLAFTTDRNVVAYNKVYDTGNPSDTDPLAAAIAIDGARGTQVTGNEIDTVTGSTPTHGRGIHIAQAAPETRITDNHIRNVGTGIGNDGGDHDRAGLRISGNVVDARNDGIIGGVTTTSTKTTGPITVTDNTVSAGGTIGISVDGGDGVTATITGNAIDGGSTAALRVNAPDAKVANNRATGTVGIRAHRTDSRFLNNTALGTSGAFVLTGITQHPHQHGNNWQPVQAQGTAAPTTGTWGRGAIVWNVTPSAGGPLGWTCVEAGSPGTWKAFGTIAS